MNFPAVPDQVEFKTITDDATLAACCARWQCEPALALDTEFMRVSTFYPQAALFQVADAEGAWLIDPLTITDWEPLRQLLLNPAVVKVLHSCSEDLLVFHTCLGMMPSPLFDTQLAAAFLGEGTAISYQNLVKQHAGVELPKGETRSDWLQRPLTREQQIYAALDVAYLLPVWEQQDARLQSQGRRAWFEEDCSRLARQYATELSGDFSDYYLNFRSAWQLNAQQRAALRALAIWREQRARKRDRPRNWILKDAALYGIALTLPSSKTQLALIEEVGDKFVRFEGDQVLALLEQARVALEADCPGPVPKPLSQGQKTRVRRAQDWVEAKALELELPAEVLGRKRLLMALYYAVVADPALRPDALALPEELHGWRGPLITEALIEILRP
ncbi:MAG TPA: ribonuclease D [Hyphomicrobiales bacterium]|nr:ribonuclease D [Hyphomicrobiales bacterium]